MGRAAPIIAAVVGVAVVVGASLLLGPGGALAVGSNLQFLVPAIAGVLGTVAATATSILLGAGIEPKAPRSALDGFGAAADRTQTIRAPVAARNVIYGWAKVGGTLVYAGSSGPDRRFLNLIVTLAGHPVREIGTVWINEYQIGTDQLPPADAQGVVRGFASNLNGKVYIEKWPGTQTFASQAAMDNIADGWTASDIAFGCAYLYVRLEYDRELFPGGLSEIQAEVLGKNDLLDPRTGQTGYSTNPALVLLDYLRGPHGVGAAADAIDTASFIAAANICEEVLPATPDGSRVQFRYQCDIAFRRDLTRRTVLQQLLTSCAGTLTYIQGRYRLHVGAYSPPTDSLGPSDFAGDVRLTTRSRRREAFNALRGTFIDPKRGWQASEFPPVTSAAFEAEDGERIWKDLELPATIDAVQARRLARIELLRGREGVTIEAPVKYAALRFAVMQMLAVTVPEFGWADKPMRVRGWRFNAQTGEIALILREETAAAYAWSISEQDVPALPPGTTLASPLRIPAPRGLQAREELFAGFAGTTVENRVVLEWVTPASPFIEQYEVEVRAPESTEWRSVPAQFAGTTATVDALPAGRQGFRVRGRSSTTAGAWAELQVNVGSLAAQPPAPVAGLAVQTIAGLAYLTWQQHPDLDVRIGGQIEFRHTPETAAPSWAGSTSIGSPVAGSATSATLPLKPGSYLARARDAGGRNSATDAVVTTAQATALAFGPVTSLAEHPGFAGARTNTIVLSGTLRLDQTGDVDAEPSWDGIASLDGLGTLLPDGSYVFSAGMDLGSVRGVRLTGSLVASIVNQLTQIDQRTLTVDDWRSWDGAAGGEGDAWIEVRHTPDNPSGSPVWSPWRRLDAGEFRARGFQFRAQLRAYDPAFNIHVSQLGVAAEEVL